MKLLRLVMLVGFSLLAQQGIAHAHALQPGYLSIEPLAPDTYRVFWRKPDVQGRPMAIDVLLPRDCDPRSGPDARSDGQAWITNWVVTCPGGMAGSRVEIPGLGNTRTDVLVRFETQAGQSGTQRLTPDASGFEIPRDTGPVEVFKSYVLLGIEHILSGWDHLLFVLALMILIRDRWRLVGAITAFTAAHSVTLSAATLGLVALPPKPVEAVIALSIMFLASEILIRRDGAPRLSERAPWLVTFSFGLLHGFGFAGALGEIGLPQHETPLALLAFNVGVEIGQLAFIGAMIGLWFVTARLLRRDVRQVSPPSIKAIAFGCGCASAFWFIERMSGAF